MATTAGSRNQANGVLSVTTSQTSGNTPKQTASKPASSKMKLIVRRLAPGLTEAEFFSVIGEDWKVGQGKVDWFQYKAGKDSKEYVHLQSMRQHCLQTNLALLSHLDLLGRTSI